MNPPAPGPNMMMNSTNPGMMPNNNGTFPQQQYRPQSQQQQQQQQQQHQPQFQQSGQYQHQYQSNQQSVGYSGNPSTRKKVQLKLVILGNSGVGKTSLMNRYHSNKFTGQYKATIGADFLSKELMIPSMNNMPQKCTLQIWDTAGQERFQSLGTSFYRGADACLLVYDVTDTKSYEALTRWKDEFLRQIGRTSGSTSGRNSIYGQQPFSSGGGDGDFPFVLLGNKVDKDTNGSSERRVMRTDAEQWCRENGGSSMMPYYETSAKTAVNVENAFIQVAKMALLQAELKKKNEPAPMNMPYGQSAQTIDLNRRSGMEQKKEFDCC